MFRNNYFTIVGIITALISYTKFSWEMVQKAPPFPMGHRQTEIKNTEQRCRIFLREAEIARFTYPGHRSIPVAMSSLHSPQIPASTESSYIMRHFALPNSFVRENTMTCPRFLQQAVDTHLMQLCDNGILTACETGKPVLK